MFLEEMSASKNLTFILSSQHFVTPGLSHHAPCEQESRSCCLLTQDSEDQGMERKMGLDGKGVLLVEGNTLLLIQKPQPPTAIIGSPSEI